MPRDGEGIFSLAGASAVSGAAISSAEYNIMRADLTADLNLARPIVAGGTGATTVADARANLKLALFDGLWMNDVLALQADTALTYTGGQPGTVAAGDYVRTRKEGFSYQVAASGASDHHVTTAGGVRLKMLPTPQNRGSHLQFTGSKGILVHVGDSTLLKSSEWGVAYIADWLGVDGIFEGWTSYNLAKNGAPTSSWVASIAGGDQNAAPVDYSGVGNPTENVWQAVNADPDVIVIGTGTNDLRLTGAQDDTQFAETLRQLRVNIHRLVMFFLENTSAEIWIRLNAPIAFANPDPGGFTNFTTADRAARASAGMRVVALEWQCVSDRVRVWDTHKALFGLRIDSVTSAVDPEGQIDFSSGGSDYGLMKDTLHPTNLGWQRVCQFVSRAMDMSRPRTTAAKVVPSIVRNGAISSVLVEIKESGVGYVDIYANAIHRLVGSLTRGRGRAPTTNIREAESLLACGYGSQFRDMLRANSFALGGLSGGTATSAVIVGGFTWAYNAVDGLDDFIRISGTITGTVVSGFAMAYIQDATRLPRYPALQEPIQIQIGGAIPLTSGAASGATPIPSTTAFPSINANTVSSTRRSSSGAATVDLYLCNRFDGAYVNPVGGVVLSAAPGHRLGQVTIPSGHLGVTTWAKDATNYPSGDPVPVYALNSNTFIAAVLTSGGMGDAGMVMIRST